MQLVFVTTATTSTISGRHEAQVFQRLMQIFREQRGLWLMYNAMRQVCIYNSSNMI